jgi:hypothetical protein
MRGGADYGWVGSAMIFLIGFLMFALAFPARKLENGWQHLANKLQEAHLPARISVR